MAIREGGLHSGTRGGGCTVAIREGGLHSGTRGGLHSGTRGGAAQWQ